MWLGFFLFFPYLCLVRGGRQRVFGFDRLPAWKQAPAHPRRVLEVARGGGGFWEGLRLCKGGQGLLALRGREGIGLRLKAFSIVLIKFYPHIFMTLIPFPVMLYIAVQSEVKGIPWLLLNCRPPKTAGKPTQTINLK